MPTVADYHGLDLAEHERLVVASMWTPEIENCEPTVASRGRSIRARLGLDATVRAPSMSVRDGAAISVVRTPLMSRDPATALRDDTFRAASDSQEPMSTKPDETAVGRLTSPRLSQCRIVRLPTAARDGASSVTKDGQATTVSEPTAVIALSIAMLWTSWLP